MTESDVVESRRHQIGSCQLDEEAVATGRLMQARSPGSDRPCGDALSTPSATVVATAGSIAEPRASCVLHQLVDEGVVGRHRKGGLQLDMRGC